MVRHDDCIEAVQLDELHALQIPALDMRLLNAIINKRIAALNRERDLDALKQHARYTKRLAAYNPEKWRRHAERYEALLSMKIAAQSIVYG